MTTEAKFALPKTREALLSSLKKINVSLVPPAPIPRVATDILSLDTLFEGGLPESRVVEIFGPENSGKSTIGTIILARQYIRHGRHVAIMDAEKSFDADYARKWGFDPDELDENGRRYLDIYRTDTAEQWLEALRFILASGQYDLVVIDSLAKFAPRVEVESSMDKGTMGVFPRLMARFWRVLGAVDFKATLVVLNQERLDIGNANIYTGAPKTSPGGNATKHEGTVKIQMLKPQDMYDNDVPVGMVFRMKVVKSKIFKINIKRTYELRVAIEGNRHDIDYSYELYIAAKDLGLLTDKDGKPYESRVAYYNGEKIANGEEQILAFFDDPSDLRERLEADIRARLIGGIVEPIPYHSFDLETTPEPEASIWSEPDLTSEAF